MANFETLYKKALIKTAEKNVEYTKMYENVHNSNHPNHKLLEAICEKEIKKLPGMLARDYLDFLCEAVEECDGLTGDDFGEFDRELSMYQRYYDSLDHNGYSKGEIDIEWSELPEEALLPFVNYNF